MNMSENSQSVDCVDTKQTNIEGWECSSCGLMNFSVISKCQACFTSKFGAEFDLKKGYSNLSDEDLVEIIIKCEREELQEIYHSLEFKNAVYKNHSLLSLLIDIGRINLIFLLFQKGFKFALNYAPSNIKDNDTYYNVEETKEEDKNAVIYVDDDKILPLSMAFERDEKYLIKLLLKKGASPNQCTRPENLSLNYEWFDLSQYCIYLHYLPISIPIHKAMDDPMSDIAEWREIFDVLISFGALWYEDEYMFLFCNKDASFWMDFLSSYDYRTERYYIHDSMKKYYDKTIKPIIMEHESLRCIEYIMKQYFVTFPMIDIPAMDQVQHYGNNISIDIDNDDINIQNIMNTADNDSGNNGNNEEKEIDDIRYRSVSLSEIPNIVNSPITNNSISPILSSPIRLTDIYAKVIDIKEQNDDNKEYEYTIIDENDVKINILIHDERVWKELKIDDVIHIKNGILLNQTENIHNINMPQLQLNNHSSDDENKTAGPAFKIVHSMTLTPSISVIYDQKIKEKFENTH